MEGLRMFSQARAGTLPTEADQLWHWPKHSTYPLPQLLAFIQHAALSGHLPPQIEWTLQAMDRLLQMWHVRELPGIRQFGVHGLGLEAMTRPLRRVA